jgi:hypothetical protein
LWGVGTSSGKTSYQTFFWGQAIKILETTFEFALTLRIYNKEKNFLLKIASWVWEVRGLKSLGSY